MSSTPKRKKRLSEQAFIEKWWKDRFPEAAPPAYDSPISCVCAVDLLQDYRNYLKRLERVR